MSILDNIREGLFSALQSPGTQTKAPSKAKGDFPTMSARMDLLELPEPPDKKNSEYLDAYRSWVYSCVKAIANEVSKIELVLYKRVGEKVEEVAEHEAIETLERVNDFQTHYEFVEGVQTYLELVGEAFVYKYQGSNGMELWTLRPDYIEILPPKKENDFIGGYKYKVTGVDTPQYFEPEEIIHFKYFNPKNPYRGLSTLKAASYAYDTDFFATKWNRNFFYNNAIPSTILTTDQTLKEKEIKRIKTQWNNKFKGVGKAHLFALLTGGLKLDTGFKQSMKDMEFLNLRKYSRDEIFSIFQVPKSIVSITDDVNRANAMEHRAIFIENTIKPKMERFVSFLNEFYIKDFPGGENMYFGFKDPSPDNVEMNLKVVELALSKTNVSWLTVNEVREMLGYDNIGSDGDRLFTGFGMVDSIGGNQQDQQRSVSYAVKSDGKKDKVIVRHKRKGALEIRAEEIKNIVKHSDAFKNIVYKMISKKKDAKEEVKELNLRYVPQDVAEKFWKNMVVRTEAQERMLKSVVNKFFKQQRDQVLVNLREKKSVKSPADTYIFDEVEETNALVEIVDPIMREIVQTAGDEALELLDSSNSFKFIDEVINAIKQNTLLFASSVNSTTRSLLQEAISAGIANQEGVDKIASRVRGVYSDATKKRAQEIARTETIRASNLGSVAGYRQSGLVEFKEWLTALDERTCEFCLAMEKEYRVRRLDETFLAKGTELKGVDGGIYKVNYDDLLAPPLHPSCRCTVLPVVNVLDTNRSFDFKKYLERKTRDDVVVALRDEEKAIRESIAKVTAELETAMKDIDRLKKEKKELVRKDAKKRRDEAIAEAQEIVSDAKRKKKKMLSESMEIRDKLREKLYE